MSSLEYHSKAQQYYHRPRERGELSVTHAKKWIYKDSKACMYVSFTVITLFIGGLR